MIYFDSAATSLRKPDSVSAAVFNAVRHYSTPGRGNYFSSRKAAECVYLCRETAAQLFHVGNPERVIFTMNATHGLNLAVNSLVRPGSTVLLTGLEHNAVYRPITARRAAIICPPRLFLTDDEWCEYFRENLPRADVAVITHVSNVFGNVLPLAELSLLCRDSEVPFLVDAAQSAGHISIEFDDLGADFLAVPGHKGLLGPQGTGLLLCRKNGSPLLFGGTGNQSDSPLMPEELPERLEAGTQNICGIAGLLAGMRFVLCQQNQITKREAQLTDYLMHALDSVGGLRIIRAGNCCNVISFVPEQLSCEEIEEGLDRHGIAVRSGLHCAPLAHRTGGTISSGTVRFSLSFTNTTREIDQTITVLKKILKN